jgi:hypothetical protein
MFIFIRIMLLAGFVRLLVYTENPLLCSILWGILIFLIRLASGGPILAVLVYAGFRFAMASLYFWLLNRIEFGSGMWWLVTVVGFILVGLL